MQCYISAEILKQKHTFTKKMVWLAPAVTLLLSILAPLWFQQNSYNWWYIMLYPGFLTLLCIFVNQKDGGKLKYRAVYPLPINLEKFWYAKIVVCMLYAAVANTILMVCNVAGGFFFSLLFKLPMKIHVSRAVLGSFLIVAVSAWNIPLCLWLSKKVGAFATLLFNIGFSLVLGILCADSDLWIICPYSWVARLMVPVLHILPNGEAVFADSALMVAPVGVCITFIFAVLLFLLVSRTTAKWFKNQEAC